MVAHSPLPHHRTCGSEYGGFSELSLPPPRAAVRFVVRHKGFAALQVSRFGFTVSTAELADADGGAGDNATSEFNVLILALTVGAFLTSVIPTPAA